jgi:phospholipid transport system substrate-binding protein
MAVLALAPPSTAAAADPMAVVEAFGDQVRQVVKDSGLTPSDRQQRFRVLIDENFDFPTMARFVLGTAWRTASDESRREFTTVFAAYMVQSFGGLFGRYDGAQLDVMSEREEGSRSIIVASKLGRPDSDPATKVYWNLRSMQDGFKIVDVSTSGVSMAVTYRDQFAAVIEQDRGDLSALIDRMRGKLDRNRAD